LFPNEFLQFVTCEAAPLDLRRAVAIDVYTYLRLGELRVLGWDEGDIDLVHGALSVTRAMKGTKVKPTKSGETGPRGRRCRSKGSGGGARLARSRHHRAHIGMSRVPASSPLNVSEHR
jgi:hypothetical protein